jgi:hypothetical protein
MFDHIISLRGMFEPIKLVLSDICHGYAKSGIWAVMFHMLVRGYQFCLYFYGISTCSDNLLCTTWYNGIWLINLWRCVLGTTLCDNVCQWLVACRWLSLISSTNKTDRHDVTEILLKITLNTIILPLPPFRLITGMCTAWLGAVVVVIGWYLDLELHMQSVPITSLTLRSRIPLWG